MNKSCWKCTTVTAHKRLDSRYSENLQYKQASKGLARELVDARKCMREEELEAVEKGTRDTMSLDAHDLLPDPPRTAEASGNFTTTGRILFYKS
jgi:hypothetical protein